MLKTEGTRKCPTMTSTIRRGATTARVDRSLRGPNCRSHGHGRGRPTGTGCRKVHVSEHETTVARVTEGVGG